MLKVPDLAKAGQLILSVHQKGNEMCRIILLLHTGGKYEYVKGNCAYGSALHLRDAQPPPFGEYCLFIECKTDFVVAGYGETKINFEKMLDK